MPPLTADARPRVDERLIQPRAALRRRRAEARPEVHALRAGQHGVEHEQREEVGVGRRRRVIRRSSDRPSCPRFETVTRRSPSCSRLARVAPASDVAGRNAAEMLRDARASRRSVSTSPTIDQRGVVRHVEAAVVAVEIVARHRLQIGQPADRRMPVGVRAERRRRQLLIEQLSGSFSPPCSSEMMTVRSDSQSAGS